MEARKIIAACKEALAETLWPTRCVGCDAPGSLLCEECAQKLPLIDANIACERCGAPYGSFVCSECMPPGSVDREGQPCGAEFAFARARAACSYEGVAKQLVTAYKDGGEQRLAALLAYYIYRAVDGTLPSAEAGEEAPRPASWLGELDALVCVPPRPGAVRARGFDHMELVVQELSRLCKLPLLHPLRTAGKVADQRLLGRQQRQDNRANSFETAGSEPLPPRLLLVDDVLTTGATCSAAAAALQNAGAREVSVAVFARVW